jgi:hypothetical protein
MFYHTLLITNMCVDSFSDHHKGRFTGVLRIKCGPGSSVGIGTELRAGRSGIESRWGRDFPPSRPALEPT